MLPQLFTVHALSRWAQCGLELEVAIGNLSKLTTVEQSYPISLHSNKTVLLELLEGPAECLTDCTQPRRQRALGGFKLEADAIGDLVLLISGLSK